MLRLKSERKKKWFSTVLEDFQQPSWNSGMCDLGNLGGTRFAVHWRCLWPVYESVLSLISKSPPLSLVLVMCLNLLKFGNKLKDCHMWTSLLCGELEGAGLLQFRLGREPSSQCLGAELLLFLLLAVLSMALSCREGVQRMDVESSIQKDRSRGGQSLLGTRC